MYCRKCGTQVPDDSIYCSKCGTKVQPEVASAPPPGQDTNSPVQPSLTTHCPADIPIQKTRTNNPHIAGWVISVVMFLLFLLFLIAEDNIPIVYFLAGIVINPMFRERVHLKTWIAVTLCVCLFLIGVSYAGQTDESGSDLGQQASSEEADEPVDQEQEDTSNQTDDPEKEASKSSITEDFVSEEDIENAFGSAVGYPVETVTQIAEQYEISLIFELDGADITKQIDDYQEGYLVDRVRFDDYDNEAQVTIMTEQDYAEKEQREALTEKLNPIFAWPFVQEYGDSIYPYGFKLHYVLGKISEEMKDPDTWILTAECEVTNAFGATGSFVCSAEVTGTNERMELVSFVVE